MDPWSEFADASADDPWAEFADAGPTEPPTKPAGARKRQKRKRSWVDETAGFMANLNRGLAVGDEFAAGAKTAANALTGKVRFEPGIGNAVQAVGDEFRANMAQQRQVEDEFREDRPMTAALATGTGNALTVAAPVGATGQTLALGTRGVNALRGATTAGLAGAGYAAADRGTVQERVGAATDPVMLGVSAGLGGVTGAMGPAVRDRLPKANRKALARARTEAYGAVDRSGVKYKPDTVEGLADVIELELKSAKFNPSRHGKTASILKDEIQALRGTSPSPTELDQLRQVIYRDVIASGDKSEQRLGKIMIAQIDDFMDVAGPKQVIAGDPKAASEAIRNARDLNTRVSKIEAIDKAVDKARRRAGSTYSGGNVNNATRQNLRALMEKTPNLTAAEKEAFERVIMGTASQNMLRQVGKLSPQGNGLMMAGHLAAAPMTGGASAIFAGAGAGAKIAADRMTMRRVDDLVRLIAAGGNDAAPAMRELTQALSSQPGMRKAAAAKLSAAMAAGVGTAANARTYEIDINASTDPEHLEWRRRQALD